MGLPAQADTASQFEKQMINLEQSGWFSFSAPSNLLHFKESFKLLQRLSPTARRSMLGNLTETQRRT